MILSRRADDDNDAGPSSIRFDGSTDIDVGKFFFVYENVTMRGKTDEDKAGDILCYFEGDAVDFYYETFVQNGSLVEDAKDYKKVKRILVEHYATPEEPEDNIRRAIATCLTYQDLTGSFREMDRWFEKEGFNSEARLGLLRNAVIQFPDLAQFVIYRGATSYDFLKNTVRDFVAGRTIFFSSRDENQPDQSVGSKKILKRPDALERKIDTLADQLAELSLFVKKSQSSHVAGPSSSERICSYCKKPVHGANRCDVNPYRDYKCPRCGKMGHAETSCWMKITLEMTCKVGFGGASSESETEKKLSTGDSKSSPDQVTVVTESTEDEVVAAAKRNAVGESLPKQQKTDGIVPIRSLLNSTPSNVPMQVVRPLAQHIATRPRRQKSKKKTNSKARKMAIPDHVGKYDVLPELARAPSGLTFGQLIRGDAESAKVEIRKVLSKTARTGRSLIAQIADGSHHRRLKVVSVKVYGTVSQALLDSGAVPNLMSASLAGVLSLSPEPTTKKIMVADGTSAVVRGFLTGIPISFENLTVHLDFLVVEGTPVDIIIGCPALETLQAQLDMGEQHVTLTVGDHTVQLGLEYDIARHRVFENGTDSEEFTSASEDESSDSESEDDDLVVALLDEDPFEPDLSLQTQGLSDFDNEDGRRAPYLFDKTRHLPTEFQKSLVEKLETSGVVAWTLDDLRPSDVPVQHEFELADDSPIHFSPRRLPPRYSEVVRCGATGCSLHIHRIL